MHAASGAAYLFPLVAILSIPSPSLYLLLLLFFAGVALHGYACAVNDLADKPLDARNPARATAPLVSGEISRSMANSLVGTSAVLFLALSALIGVSQSASGLFASILAALFLLATHGVSNAFQKRSIHPFVMDVLFGLNMGVLPGLYVGLLVGHLSCLAWGAAVTNTLAMMLLNVTAGNLKDLSQDLECGERTSAIEFGVTQAAMYPHYSRRYVIVVLALFFAQATTGLAIALSSGADFVWLAGVIASAAFYLLSLLDLCQLLTCRRVPHPTGREPFIVFNFLGLMSALLHFSVEGVIGVTAFSVAWFFGVDRMIRHQRRGSDATAAADS